MTLLADAGSAAAALRQPEPHSSDAQPGQSEANAIEGADERRPGFYAHEGRTYSVRENVNPRKGTWVAWQNLVIQVERVSKGIAYFADHCTSPITELVVLQEFVCGKGSSGLVLAADVQRWSEQVSEAVRPRPSAPAEPSNETQPHLADIIPIQKTQPIADPLLPEIEIHCNQRPESQSKATGTNAVSPLRGKGKALTKSKERIQKHGEVFTPQWMVEFMLNLEDVKAATVSLNKTFMEPAAGDGNFLVEILDRKLAMVRKWYARDLEEFENYALCALSTLYGVELLTDNALACRENMLSLFVRHYTQEAAGFEARYGVEHGRVLDSVIEAARTIISVNIINGNFLTNLDVDGNPIYIYWWEFSSRVGSHTHDVSYTRVLLSEIGNKGSDLLTEPPLIRRMVAAARELNGASLVA